MTKPTKELYFDSPPVADVVLSLQFEAVEGMHAGVTGVLWDRFRSRYPRLELAPELVPQIERFGVIPRRLPTPRISFQEATQIIPRYVMWSADSGLVLHLQKDRVMLNWKRTQDANENPTNRYPGYPALKEELVKEYSEVVSVFAELGLGAPKINQVEAQYINRISAEGRELSEVFGGLILEPKCADLETDGFFAEFKNLIKDEKGNFGRLHTRIEKGRAIDNGEMIFVLNFTARANPRGDSIDAAVVALGQCREVVQTFFRTLTTINMQKHWKAALEDIDGSGT